MDTHVGGETLSQSGVLAINSLLERLIENGERATAELCAKSTLRAKPNQVSFAIRLVETYHRAGDHRRFFDSLSDFILPQRGAIDADTWIHLQALFKDFAPSNEQCNQDATA